MAEPKTAKSRRPVELPPLAAQAPHDHCKRIMAEGYARIERVFVNTEGRSLYRSEFHRCGYKPLLKRAGLAAIPIRFQDLLHPSATLLLADGVHPKIVQERLGHSQLGTTMDTYSHVMSGTGRDAADRLGEMPGTPVPKAAGA